MEEMNENRMSHATQKIGEGVVELKEAAVDRAVQFKDATVMRANEFKDAAVRTTQDTFEKCCTETESYIRTKPLQSILMALGIGLLAGMFMRK